MALPTSSGRSSDAARPWMPSYRPRALVDKTSTGVRRSTDHRRRRLRSRRRGRANHRSLVLGSSYTLQPLPLRSRGSMFFRGPFADTFGSSVGRLLRAVLAAMAAEETEATDSRFLPPPE